MLNQLFKYDNVLHKYNWVCLLSSSAVVRNNEHIYVVSNFGLSENYILCQHKKYS